MLGSQRHERRFGEAQDDVSAPSLDAAKAALLAEGVEVFRVDDDTIQLAQRVRSHLMDAGVAVRVGDDPAVLFTVRVQSSDFPGVGADDMFVKVREAIAEMAAARGFSESDSHRRRIVDPVDASRVLDVWYELTFEKPLLDVTRLRDDVRWALGVGKCVGY